MPTKLKLKPCPFCGAAARMEQFGPNLYAAECAEQEQCYGIGGLGHSEDEAARKWNRRATDASKDV